MTFKESFNEFEAALREADAAGPLPFMIDATVAVQVIAMIQLACRHPGTRGMDARKIAEKFARLLQGELENRSPELGRHLERGWHTVFDVDR